MKIILYTEIDTNVRSKEQMHLTASATLFNSKCILKQQVQRCLSASAFKQQRYTLVKCASTLQFIIYLHH